MKKNWTMRVALLMVALTLITSCFVSGTYAKYITTADGEDTARVAKFGVVITSAGTLFADTYKATSNTPGASGDDVADVASLTVVSSGSGVAAGTDVDNVVAPGTKNDEGLTFTVTGTPEVAVKVTLNADASEEIFLKAKTGLPDMTTALATDTFDLANDYYPVVFTLTIGSNAPVVGSLADIQAALAATPVTYPANSDLSTEIGTITLTWEWAFGTAGAVSGNDQADTLLGDLAAGTTLAPATTLTAGTDYNLNEVVNVTIAIEQID